MRHPGGCARLPATVCCMPQPPTSTHVSQAVGGVHARLRESGTRHHQCFIMIMQAQALPVFWMCLCNIPHPAPQPTHRGRPLLQRDMRSTTRRYTIPPGAHRNNPDTDRPRHTLVTTAGTACAAAAASNAAAAAAAYVLLVLLVLPCV